jgi:hypothetical protein
MRIVSAVFVLQLALTPLAIASDITKSEAGVDVSEGRNPSNRHGHSIFHSIRLEIVGSSPWVERRLPGTRVGAALTYSDVIQARSWFGYTYGDPDDRIRAEMAQGFLRHSFGRSWHGARPFAELGTGVMWSNRRIPAATSRLNFNSYLVGGLGFFEDRKWPLRIGYQFAHISNGGITSRNPGLNVNALLIGTRVKNFRK